MDIQYEIGDCQATLRNQFESRDICTLISNLATMLFWPSISPLPFLSSCVLAQILKWHEARNSKRRLKVATFATPLPLYLSPTSLQLKSIQSERQLNTISTSVAAKNQAPSLTQQSKTWERGGSWVLFMSFWKSIAWIVLLAAWNQGYRRARNRNRLWLFLSQTGLPPPPQHSICFLPSWLESSV